MKNIKSVLALVMAVCLMMSLAVTAFAEEVSVLSAPAETTAATTEATEAATEEATEAATSDATEAATEPKSEETVDEHEGHDHSTETTGAAEVKEVSPVWKTVRVILAVLEVFASLIMVAVVLFQSGKEAGLSGAISGNNDSYASKNDSRDKKLAKATKWVAIAWLVLTLALCLIP